MSIDPKDKVISLIQERGYIFLDEFIDISLNKLTSSYYRSENPLGKKGDFITAPEVSQLYGEIIGIYIADHINKNNIKRFNLIELGPGKGTLMSDVRRVLSSISRSNINYNIHFVEINEHYKKNLATLFTGCSIYSSVDQLPNDYSIVIANEFFDVFPIVQAQKIHNKLYETIITMNSGELIFDKKEIRDEYKSLFNLDMLHNNHIIEKSPIANLVFDKMVKLLIENAGMMLTMDYGYTSNPNINTLQSIKDNNKTNFFDNIGKQDLTSSVNFKVFLEILEENKVSNKSIKTQRDFLITNGINYRAEMLIEKNREKEKEILSQVSRLIDIDKMGSLFKFLQFSINT